MGYDLSSLITQGFQNSSAARDNAFRNFAQGAQSVGEGVHALQQRGWNNENDRLMQEWYNMQAPQEDSETGEKLDPAAMLDPELLRLNEMQRRLHNLKGHAKGLRTNYTPQDYLKLDAEAQAMEAARQKAEADAAAEQLKYERGVLGKFNESDMLKFDALNEFDHAGEFSEAVRNQALAAILEKSGVKSDEVKTDLLGQLSPEKEKLLRERLLQTADSAGHQFGQQLKGILTKQTTLPALFGGLVAFATESATGQDHAVAQRLRNEIDKAFKDGTLDAPIAKYIRSGYSDENREIGQRNAHKRDYGLSKEDRETAAMARKISEELEVEKNKQNKKPAAQQKTKPVKQSSTEGF